MKLAELGMTKAELLENACRRLRAFDGLQRKNTDDAGWLALAYSMPRNQAKKLAEKARAQMAKESPE